MAKKSKYGFSESTPYQTVEKRSKEGIITMEQVQGVYPFGTQCDLITDENLTDAMAEFLLSKEDYADFIVTK